ncbi:glycosyltransferase family 4 protein [Candidatus Micrarchaeota archaeon]|nr:glycosyltransferase family 4 protein [Candidatus Micrarchaeota archaeon]
MLEHFFEIDMPLRFWTAQKATTFSCSLLTPALLESKAELIALTFEILKTIGFRHAKLQLRDPQFKQLSRCLRTFGLKIPIIFTWHIPFVSQLPEFWKQFFIENMSNYNKVVFSIEEYTNSAISCGLNPNLVETVHPTIDLEKYAPKEQYDAREKYNVSKDDILIVCVSRIDPRKGQEILIAAMDRIVNTHKQKNVKCIFVGNGSFSRELLGKERSGRAQKLLNLVEEKGLQDNVFFTGKVNDELLYHIYGASDIVVQPSLHEGFGLTVCEAMVFGKPIIGSNVGGIPLQLKDGINGYLFDKADHNQLAEKILLLAQNSELRKKMGTEGARIVREKFNSGIGYAEYLRIYNEISK